MLKFLRKLFPTNDDLKAQYLERSTSLEDFERRFEEIEKGNAPFQKFFWP